MVQIDNRNIFFEKLKTGINLFTGAGFSVLESPLNESLPVVKDLVIDICKGKRSRYTCSMLRNYKFHRYRRIVLMK